MSEPVAQSMVQGMELGLWSSSLSRFYRRIRELTTVSTLSLAHVLDELRERSTAEGVFLLSRVADPSGTNVIRWRKCGSSFLDPDRKEWMGVEDKESFRLLVDWLVDQTRTSDTSDVQAEFTPSWVSDQGTAGEGTLAAIRAIQDLEHQKGLDRASNELRGWGPVCGFPLGHVTIGKWQLGESILVMTRLMSLEDAGKIRFLEDTRQCLITFLAFLAEANSHLLRKRSLERLPVPERQQYFSYAKCAGAYVRTVCRLASLWKEHPEVGIEEYPGSTVECLALIGAKHDAGPEVFGQGFAVEDAVAKFEEVREALLDR